LIVEDDAELRGVLRRGLEEEGLSVETAGTGAEALARVETESPDALVIDIGLPDADGRDLCQALRVRGVRAPVLFLTARDALVDRLPGSIRAGTTTSPSRSRSPRSRRAFTRCSAGQARTGSWRESA